jgi:HEAT repeat protein
MPLMPSEGEIRETLGLAIPSVIKLLESSDSNVRDAAASIIGQLAKHGEC